MCWEFDFWGLEHMYAIKGFKINMYPKNLEMGPVLAVPHRTEVDNRCVLSGLGVFLRWASSVA
jgi:hypothetical protein